MKQSQLAELKSTRFKLITRLYELTHQNIHEAAEIAVLRAELNLTVEETGSLLDYLEGEGLLKYRGPQHVAITHRGIVEVERALAAPDEPTTYFPPAATVNIINVGQMTSSHIQQATKGSYQVQGYLDFHPEAQTALLKGLDLLENSLPESRDLPDDKKAEILDGG